MATIKRFEEIRAWQTARALCKEIYALSGQGTFGRDYGLRDQMRRAAVSVLSNIAEGFESATTPLFLNYLGRAKASAGELRAQLYVALDAGYITADQFTTLRDTTEKASGQLSRFIAYLEANAGKRRVRDGVVQYEVEER